MSEAALSVPSGSLQPWGGVDMQPHRHLLASGSVSGAGIAGKAAVFPWSVLPMVISVSAVSLGINIVSLPSCITYGSNIWAFELSLCSSCSLDTLVAGIAVGMVVLALAIAAVCFQLGRRSAAAAAAAATDAGGDVEAGPLIVKNLFISPTSVAGFVLPPLCTAAPCTAAKPVFRGAA